MRGCLLAAKVFLYFRLRISTYRIFVMSSCADFRKELKLGLTPSEWFNHGYFI